MHVNHNRKTGQADVLSAVQDPTVLLRSNAICTAPIHFLVAHTLHLDQEVYDAVCWRMSTDDDEFPQTFRFATGQQKVFAAFWPDITDVLRVVKLLHDKSDIWTISVLEMTVVSLGVRLATDANELSYEFLLEKNGGVGEKRRGNVTRAKQK